jgi:23S rRNA pseudouridine2605 synthase
MDGAPPLRPWYATDSRTLVRSRAVALTHRAELLQLATARGRQRSKRDGGPSRGGACLGGRRIRPAGGERPASPAAGDPPDARTVSVPRSRALPRGEAGTVGEPQSRPRPASGSGARRGRPTQLRLATIPEGAGGVRPSRRGGGRACCPRFAEIALRSGRRRGPRARRSDEADGLAHGHEEGGARGECRPRGGARGGGGARFRPGGGGSAAGARHAAPGRGDMAPARPCPVRGGTCPRELLGTGLSRPRRRGTLPR